MGVLGPIVLSAPSRPVKVLQIQHSQGCWVRSQVIGDDAPWLDRLATQKSLKELSGSPRVPPTLHHQLHQRALVVDCAREKQMRTAVPADHHVNVPAGRGGGTGLLQAPDDGRSEILNLAPDRLVSHRASALGEDAQAETRMEPGCVYHYVWREAVALERQGLQIQPPHVAPAVPRCGDKLALACPHRHPASRHPCISTRFRHVAGKAGVFARKPCGETGRGPGFGRRFGPGTGPVSARGRRGWVSLGTGILQGKLAPDLGALLIPLRNFPLSSMGFHPPLAGRLP